MADDILSVVLEVDDDKATVKLNNFHQKLKIVSDDIYKTGNNKTFAGKLSVDLDALVKKSNETHKAFQQIASARLDAGNIGNLSKEIFAAKLRSEQLVSDIANIRRELANPARKSSIAFLTEELKGAQTELGGLERKLTTVNLPTPQQAVETRIGRLRGYGALLRGVGSPVGEMELNAGISVYEKYSNVIAESESAVKKVKEATLALAAAKEAVTIATASEGAASTAATAAKEAEAAATAQLAAAETAQAAATSSALAKIALIASPIAAAGVVIAAAGYTVYNLTKDVRNEYEGQLKALEHIVALENNRIQQSKEIADNFAKARTNAQYDRFNDDYDSNASEQQLRDKRAQLLEREKITPQMVGIPDGKGNVQWKPSEEYQKLNNEIIKLDGLIEQSGKKYLQSISDATQRDAENFKKAQDQKLEYQIKKAEEWRRYNESQTNKSLSRLLGNDLTVSSLKEATDLFNKNKASLSLNSQESGLKLIADAQKKLIETQTSFREFLSSTASQQINNQFVKIFGEIDTAGERAEKRFHSLGQAAVDFAANAEKANLTKALGLQRFDNNFQALKYNQQAERLAATPQTQFAPFEQAISKFSTTVDFLVKDNSLSRKIAEAGYYANSYDPNNPKSFSEANKDYFHGDTSSIGQQIRFALDDITSIKSVTNETGVYGRGVAADKILSLIPDIQELVKKLNASGRDGDARALLNEYQQALFDSREAQRQKFEDAMVIAKNQDFGRRFANEQISLINNDRSLSESEKIKRRLSVTDALGNDLDPRLEQQKIRDLVDAARDKQNEDKEAKQWKTDIKNSIGTIVDALTKNGISVPSVNVNFQSNDAKTKASVVPASTPKDTANAYSDYHPRDYTVLT